MTNLTTLSHMLLLLLVYVCTVHALTDEDLEKILNDAVSSEDIKELRRFPDLDELGELKDRLEAIETIDSEDPVFGSVNPSPDEDGIYSDYFRRENDRIDREPFNFPIIKDSRRKQLQNEDFQLQSLKPPIDKTITRGLFPMDYTGRVRRDDAGSHKPLLSSKQLKDSDSISHPNNLRNANDVEENFLKSMIDRLKNCLKDKSCLQRQIARSNVKEPKSDIVKVQTRNPFCPRRGCGKRRKRPSGDQLDILADSQRGKTPHKSQADKRNRIGDEAAWILVESSRKIRDHNGNLKADENDSEKASWTKVKNMLKIIQNASPFEQCGINPDSCMSQRRGRK